MPKPASIGLHSHVAAARAAAGCTQQELATAVGVTRQTIIAIEKGNYVPSVLLALKLADYFDVSVHDLFDF